MKNLLTLLTCLLLLSPNVVLGEMVKFKVLVKRDGVYYKKFTDVPFSGKVTGERQVRFKDGRKEGAYIAYHENGQLRGKGNYKDDEQEGEWVYYKKDGTVD